MVLTRVFYHPTALKVSPTCCTSQVILLKQTAFKGGGKVHPQHHGTEQGTLKDVNNFLNTNIYSYLGTSGGESQNLHLNVVHFFNTSVNQTSVAA